MIHDGPLDLLAALLDGEAAQVILFDADYDPSPTQKWVSDMTGIVARQTVTLTAEVVDGVLTVDWEEDVSIDIDGAPVIAGWVLALDGANDAARRILRSAVYTGGAPPDPFTITVPSGAFRQVR